MLTIRIGFPSGVFRGASEDDPKLPEWPPHPARLYSALVASAYRSQPGMIAERRSALEWLETLPPPHVHAPSAHQGPAPTVFVPPGDAVGQKGNESYEHPIHRWRQPRQFPHAVIMGDPEVHYVWNADPDPQAHAALQEIAAGVTHVGTSHSMAVVSVDTGDLVKPASLSPDADGEVFMRVPVPGRLAELDAAHGGTLGIRRPTPVFEPIVAFRSTDQTARAPVPGQFELVVLRLLGPPCGLDTAHTTARAVRRALMSHLGDSAPAAVHGHGDENHVAWLPLGDVGHAHAAGRVIGIGVGLPLTLSDGVKQTILAALGGLDHVRTPDGRPTRLVPLQPGVRHPATLMRSTWCRISDTWATVTPVVLDRAPKRSTPERLERAMRDSITNAGFPEPVEVEVSPWSKFKGAPGALDMRLGRPRYHATVRFAEAVAGPVIAGRLRFYGVGLFRPVDGD